MDAQRQAYINAIDGMLFTLSAVNLINILGLIIYLVALSIFETYLAMLAYYGI